MGLLKAWQEAKAGETVSIRPRGNSMRGLIASGALVVVAPCVAARLERDDIILVKVSGRIYLHKVLSVDVERGKVLVGNNRGITNGWASFANVAGIAVVIEGQAQRGTLAKVRHRFPDEGLGP